MPEFKCSEGVLSVETSCDERESVRIRRKCKDKKVVFVIIFTRTLALGENHCICCGIVLCMCETYLNIRHFHLFRVFLTFT